MKEFFLIRLRFHSNYLSEYFDPLVHACLEKSRARKNMKIYCDFFLTLLRENVFFCRAAQVTATQKKSGLAQR